MLRRPTPAPGLTMVRSPSTGTTRSRRGTTTAKTLALFGVLAVGVVALLFWAPWEPASNAGGGTLRRADAARDAIELLSAREAADTLELADPGTGPWSAVAAFAPGVRLRGQPSPFQLALLRRSVQNTQVARVGEWYRPWRVRLRSSE